MAGIELAPPEFLLPLRLVALRNSSSVGGPSSDGARSAFRGILSDRFILCIMVANVLNILV